MSRTRMIALVSAALVAGLVLGTLGLASAATTAPAAAGTGLGASFRAAGARLVDVVASLTGAKVEDVQAKRVAGTSLASIASAKGISASEVVAKALAARKAVLDAQVKAGTITQARADQVLAFQKTRLTERVSSTAACAGGNGNCGTGGGAGGGCGMGGGQGRGMGRGAGAGAGCSGGACTTTPAQ
ncbi:MAG: hypothetical protein Q7W30_10100 [Coriobacteriia bacterium]|nr:hypothetical protein [Coriobacteriia bacterium]